MNNRIPDEKVELVRRSADIVEVIGEQVQLKKQGRQYMGLCPFHGENSPSFSVSPEKQLYHCFGCGAGGNVFTFLMEIEGLTFVDAVKKLANRNDISLPYVEETEQKKSTGPAEMMKQAHKRAAELYHHVLMLTEEGRDGRNYIKERGFTQEQMTHFQIGFSPNQWDALTKFFERQQYSMNHLVQGSLLGRRESEEGYYDRFRNRLMFPIWDNKGNVIAFGGRSISNESPKYLNSSDSPIFQKGNTLYGFHLARQAIRKEATVVLFEGYVDVIAAWGAGVKNGVATLGTALTADQARVIRRNAETVILCYDGDHAGMEATVRSAQILEEAGCHVKVASMPEGFDPDDYIRAYGSEKFRTDVVGNSLALMAFKMAFLRKGKNLQNDDDRLRYIEEVLKEISKLNRAVERDHYLRHLANEFSLSLEALKQEQYQLFRNRKRQNQHAPSQEQTQLKRKIELKKMRPAHKNAERHLLAHMIKDKEIAEWVEDRLGGRFNVEEHEAIAAYLFAFYGEGYDSNPTQFIQRLQDEKLTRIATELAMLAINENCQEEELLDYINQIESYPKRVLIQEKEAEVRLEQDPIKAAEIFMEIHRMKLDLQKSSR